MKVNDRAPARHADLESEAGVQQTRAVSLGEYIQYVEVRHRLQTASQQSKIVLILSSTVEALNEVLAVAHNVPSILGKLGTQASESTEQSKEMKSINGAPFYLNGWRAFSQHPELASIVCNDYIFLMQC